MIPEAREDPLTVRCFRLGAARPQLHSAVNGRGRSFGGYSITSRNSPSVYLRRSPVGSH